LLVAEYVKTLFMISYADVLGAMIS